MYRVTSTANRLVDRLPIESSVTPQGLQRRYRTEYGLKSSLNTILLHNTPILT